MDKSKLDLIPDDEPYELNAQELSTIDELIQEYESGEETFTNLVNVAQNLGFDVVEGHQSKEISNVSSNRPPGQNTQQPNQKQAPAGFSCKMSADADDNIVHVPVSVSDPSINPYSNEFYNKGCNIINKLRLKKHHTQEKG
jgi:uncharacterized protein YcbK (DUF882 family)